MLRMITPKEQEEHRKELIKFCKDNHCLMYNYMLDIKGIKKEVFYDIEIAMRRFRGDRRKNFTEKDFEKIKNKHDLT